MTSNVLTTLCKKLRTETFSLEIDEQRYLTIRHYYSVMSSPLITRKYVKTQELLFSTNLETYTKGSSVYYVVEICFNGNNIPITNIASCARDGAPSMVGRH